ncbi:MAG: MBL fold metallo-hydrolase [Verrucomicrobiota bacterium]
MRLKFEGQTCVQVLGSGSKGNAILIGSDQEYLLVDAGLSGKELIRRLDTAGVDVKQLAGVILTHEHQDHVRGLKGLIRVENVPVWGNEQTLQHLQSSDSHSVAWNVFGTGTSFGVGSAKVESFPVPHDAYDPCGFIVNICGVSVGILTDLGYCTDVIQRAAARCHILVLEANYDVELLSSDTKRPWATKQRIAARHGHLSNTQASELIASLKNLNSPLRHIFMSHMSEDCNDPEIAKSELRQGLVKAGLPDVRIHQTYQGKVSDCVIL